MSLFRIAGYAWIALFFSHAALADNITLTPGETWYGAGHVISCTSGGGGGGGGGGSGEYCSNNWTSEPAERACSGERKHKRCSYTQNGEEFVGTCWPFTSPFEHCRCM